MNGWHETAADPLDAVAEEFLSLRRRGETPAIEDYAAAHPELADRIRELFPALDLLEGADALDSRSALPLPNVELPAGAPQRLGDFRILREVGRGGMGVVYEAIQESLGRRVALKVLPHDVRTAGKLVERFRREAQWAGRLHHTHIVPVFGFAVTDSTCYSAMQFIDGQPLSAVLEEVRRLRTGARGSTGDGAGAATMALDLEGRCSPATDDTLAWLDKAAAISTSAASASSLVVESRASESRRREYFRVIARLGVQAATGLVHAHELRVLHRDIKPANLILDAQGALWITDFGLAKADDERDLTNTGDIIGTIRYMAPERFRGDCDGRSDVYSLGATLFEMLTLEPAFAARDRLELMRKIEAGDRPKATALDPAVPRDLETIVEKAMARDPSDRYASAAALAADLQRFIDDRPIAARRTTLVEHAWRWRRRNPALANLAAVVAVLSLLVLVVVAALGMKVRERDLQKELADERLVNSLLQEANVKRLSRQPGQRHDALDLIRRAAALA